MHKDSYSSRSWPYPVGSKQGPGLQRRARRGGARPRGAGEAGHRARGLRGTHFSAFACTIQSGKRLCIVLAVRRIVELPCM